MFGWSAGFCLLGLHDLQLVFVIRFRWSAGFLSSGFRRFAGVLSSVSKWVPGFLSSRFEWFPGFLSFMFRWFCLLYRFRWSASRLRLSVQLLSASRSLRCLLCFFLDGLQQPRRRVLGGQTWLPLRTLTVEWDQRVPRCHAEPDRTLGEGRNGRVEEESMLPICVSKVWTGRYWPGGDVERERWKLEWFENA